MKTDGAMYCFVVLHYKTIDETVKCVESIESTISYPTYHIVVVDNGSGDGTGGQLLARYDADPRVTVLLNDENLGFARGNNVGFRYAKHQLGCSYLCMLNSDIVVTQRDMCERSIAVMEQTGSALVGPLIVNPNGSKLGPHTMPGLSFLRPDMRDMRVALQLARRGIDPSRVIALRRVLHTLFVRGYRKQRPVPLDPQLQHDDVVIEGCCLFFSPAYIRRFEGLDDRTFLYHEEDLLYLRLQKSGMRSHYEPSLSVYHNHHATTRVIAATELEHKVFRYTHQLESRKVLISELESLR